MQKRTFGGTQVKTFFYSQYYLVKLNYEKQCTYSGKETTEEMSVFRPRKQYCSVLQNNFILMLAGMTPSTLNEGMKEDGLSIKSNLLPNENQVCSFTLFEKIPHFCQLRFFCCTIPF